MNSIKESSYIWAFKIYGHQYFCNIYYTFFSYNFFYSFVTHTHTHERRETNRQTETQMNIHMYSILNKVSLCEKILRICLSETKYAYQWFEVTFIYLKILLIFLHIHKLCICSTLSLSKIHLLKELTCSISWMLRIVKQ